MSSTAGSSSLPQHICSDGQSPTVANVEVGIPSETNVVDQVTTHVQYQSDVGVVAGIQHVQSPIPEHGEDLPGETSGDSQGPHVTEVVPMNNQVVGHSENSRNREIERLEAGNAEARRDNRPRLQNGRSRRTEFTRILTTVSTGILAVLLQVALENKTEPLTVLFTPCVIATFISILASGGLIKLSETDGNFPGKITIMNFLDWATIVSTICALGLVFTVLLQKA